MSVLKHLTAPEAGQEGPVNAHATAKFLIDEVGTGNVAGAEETDA